MNLLREFISALILTIVQVYAWAKIVQNKKDIRKSKYILIIFGLTLCSVINFNIVNQLIKNITMVIVAILFCKLLFNERLKNSVICVFVDYFLLIISDALFGLLLLLSNSGLSNLLDSYSGSIIADVFVSLLVIIFIRTKLPLKVYKLLVKYTRNIGLRQLLVFLLIVIGCSGSIFGLTYYNHNVLLALVINSIIVFIYAATIILIIRTKNNYISIHSKYNTNLENLQAQESIINDYRIMNHENKNNLLTIKAMTKNKKINGYIDSLIDKNNHFNNDIINSTLNLPEGGIRGLIYSKILLMREYHIECNLNIDKKITTKSLSTISDSDVVDICQILGVFIDNAIEESRSSNSNVVNIDLHVSGAILIITISNFHNHLFKKLGNDTVLKTTKGKGHGYGLQLVKRIINNNDRLSNERDITKDTFTQKLLINL